MFVPFKELSADAKVWIYIGDNRLNQAEKNELLGKLEPFLSRWKSEGKEFKSSYELIDDQILVIGGVSEGFALSGCTMDALKKTVMKWDETLKMNFTLIPKFCYRQENKIICRSQADFKKDIQAGLVSQDTIVFDNTIQSIEAYRNGIEFPLSKSWHNRVWENAKKKAVSNL